MTEKKPLAVLDIQRIGFNELKAHARHERREVGDTSHADPEKTKLNRSIGIDKCPEIAARKYLTKSGAKIDKRNEKPFTRILLSASPEYFRPGRADMTGEYDVEPMKAWVKASIKWLRQEFGQEAVHIALHRDEATVHIHAVIVPTYLKKTKRRTTRQVSHHKHPSFAGKGSYTACHDRYANMVKELGIERGERLPEDAPRKKHKTKRQWIGEQMRAISARAKELATYAASLAEWENNLGSDAKIVKRDQRRLQQRVTMGINKIIRRDQNDIS